MFNIQPHPIFGVLPNLAAVKELSARYPNWNKVMNLANQCQMAQAGITILTDAFGNQIQVDQNQMQSLQQGQQKALPANTPAAKVEGTGDAIQGLKAEINKTQGRALSTVEAGIRTDMQAGFDEIKLLLTPPASPPEE